MLRRLWIFCFGVGLLAASGAALAQGSVPESAEQNVRQSQSYERLVCTNPGFRARRIAKECGPITDPQLHKSCVASFQCNTPAHAPHWRQAPPSERIR